MRRAFTLIELLVVIGLIAVLVGAVVVASSVFINDGRVKNTRAVLAVVRDALEQFRQDETSKPTISRIGTYSNRYGRYPADELECYTPSGIPELTGGQSLVGAGTRATWFMVPQLMGRNDNYPAMSFYDAPAPDHAAYEHRDIAAMWLTIKLHSEAASAILDHISERNWRDCPEDRSSPSSPIPFQFLNRDPRGHEEWQPAEGDLQIRYLVDDWGNPFSYMAQRDWLKDPPSPADQAPPSSNHESWNEASTEIIRLNGGQPLVFSYGPDGKDQLTAAAMGDEGKASLIGDFEDSSHAKIDNSLNRDNVYLELEFAKKLALE